jgi:hypothetical protein
VDSIRIREHCRRRTVLWDEFKQCPYYEFQGGTVVKIVVYEILLGVFATGEFPLVPEEYASLAGGLLN